MIQENINWNNIHKELEKMMQETKEKKYDLFLDFDGVINRFYFPGMDGYEERKQMKEFEFYDRNCIQRVNRLCHDYPIEIIISSSWRLAGLEYCKNYLYQAGFDKEIPIVATTSYESFLPREIEIIQYLLEHKDMKGFIILDDGDMPNLKEYLVLTDCTKGYDDKADIIARNILSKFESRI